jgi:ribosomal protein S27AE
MLALSQTVGEVMSNGQNKQEKREIKTETIIEYDKEWLKLVLNGICPQCEGPLPRKGILRTCTENQHLSIYGNPVLVAYKKEKKTNYPPIRYDICPECGSSIFIEDTDRHETTCICGLVLAGPYEYGVKHPWHDTYDGVI